MTDRRRCADPKCDDGPTDSDPLPRYVQEPGLLCRRCATLLEQRIAELPAHATDLRAVLGGLKASEKGENRPTKGTAPIPLNLAAHDHLTLMHATCVSWVLMVCEERDLRGPDRNDLPVLTGWLLSQLPWLLEHGAVGDLAEEMRDLARVADGIARAKPQWHRLEAPCPHCGVLGLGRWDGESQVACMSCGTAWPEEQYPRLALVVATDPRYSLTAEQAAERSGVAGSTFRGWAATGEIKPVGTADGVRRYAVTDVDRVATKKRGEVA